MEWAIAAVAVIIGLWFVGNRMARHISRRHAETLSARTGIPAEQIYEEIVSSKVTPGDWAVAHGLDPLTFEPRRKVSADEIRAWCVQQYVVRTRSGQGLQFAFALRNADLSPFDFLWTYHKEEWPAVALEAAQRFGEDATQRLTFHFPTQEKAIRAAAPFFPPLTLTEQAVDEVVAQLRSLTEQQGWDLD